MDIESIKAKYLANDDNVSEQLNEWFHKRLYGKMNKNRRKESSFNIYLNNAGKNLGPYIELFKLDGGFRSGNRATIGIKWNGSGKVMRIPEIQQFIKKLQEAIKVIQNAPAPALRDKEMD